MIKTHNKTLYQVEILLSFADMGISTLQGGKFKNQECANTALNQLKAQYKNFIGGRIVEVNQITPIRGM